MNPLIIILIALFAVLLFAGIRIVRPTHRALIERLGKYNRFANPGFHWIVPVIEKMYQVNITEQMVDAEPQEIITNDNLNARVDAQVYFKVKSDEEHVRNSQYNVNRYQWQIVNLARTTLRNIIGTLTLKSANSERGKINSELHKTLMEETQSWGIEIVRTELKEIDPPKDVQETMNKVVKAENEKIAAIDYATATETVADGEKRAKIKEAEGYKQSKILHAEGEAEAIKLVNEAADKYFKGNAQLLRKLETLENSLSKNAKIVVPTGSDLVNIISEMAGVLPLPAKEEGRIIISNAGSTVFKGRCQVKEFIVILNLYYSHSFIIMKIKLLTVCIHFGAVLLLLLYSSSLNAQVKITQTTDTDFLRDIKKDGPTVSLLYKDTLSLPSFTEFSLPVKMVTGEEISAISLGFYYPEQYLEITGMILADSVQGFFYSDTNGLFLVAWSDINPINIIDEGTVITLKMKSLDLAGLTETIKLGIYESSEFADSSANIIEGVELEVPEIQYKIPDPIDSISGNYVKVYPNPFNDFTAINFYLKTDSRVKISLCNLAGFEMKNVVDENYLKGTHQVKLYGLYLSKGVYLLKFEIINEEETSSKLIKVVSIR